MLLFYYFIINRTSDLKQKNVIDLKQNSRLGISEKCRHFLKCLTGKRTQYLIQLNISDCSTHK